MKMINCLHRDEENNLIKTNHSRKHNIEETILHMPVLKHMRPKLLANDLKSVKPINPTIWYKIKRFFIVIYRTIMRKPVWKMKVIEKEK